MGNFAIIYYERSDGTIPIFEFLNSLPFKLQAKAFRNIRLLKENGNKLTLPFSKYLKHGIFELRIHQGSDIVRIFYFFLDDKKIILTNGFIKKTIKLPENEIVLARKYKCDYLSRKKWEEHHEN
jgi:phage-related protein